MTTTKSIAERLHSSQYPNDVPKDLSKEAHAAGIVIVFGASDDLMEFRGAIYEEISAWEGTTAYLTPGGLLESKCEDNCPYFEAEKKSAATIKAVWNNKGNPCWSYETAIPHETFDVMEDGEVYCRGIVFSLSDVKRTAP